MYRDLYNAIQNNNVTSEMYSCSLIYVICECQESHSIGRITFANCCSQQSLSLHPLFSFADFAAEDAQPGTQLFDPCVLQPLGGLVPEVALRYLREIPQDAPIPGEMFH